MGKESARIADVRSLLKDAGVAYRKVLKGERVSGQAVAALLKRREDLTRELHDLLEADAEAAQDERPMTEDELVDATIADLAALPDPLLDRVVEGLVRVGRGAAVRRAAPPPLRIVGDDG